MKIMCSYAVEIKHINRLFRDTIKIYNDAVSFCAKAFEDHWDVLKTLDKEGLGLNLTLQSKRTTKP